MPVATENRDGFTIAEVLLALLLLSFVVMGFQAATGEVIRHAGHSDQQSAAVHLADERLDRIRLDPDYERIEDRYEGVEEDVGGAKGFVRTTRITRTRLRKEAGELDFLTLTVEVEGATLRERVARTIVIGAP